MCVLTLASGINNCELFGQSPCSSQWLQTFGPTSYQVSPHATGADAAKLVWHRHTTGADADRLVWNRHTTGADGARLVWHRQTTGADAARLVWNRHTTGADAAQLGWHRHTTGADAARLVWGSSHNWCRCSSACLVSSHNCRVGQNRLYTPYMTVYLAISLPKTPYMHCIYMVLANPTQLPF